MGLVGIKTIRGLQSDPLLDGSEPVKNVGLHWCRGGGGGGGVARESVVKINGENGDLHVAIHFQLMSVGMQLT